MKHAKRLIREVAAGLALLVLFTVFVPVLSHAKDTAAPAPSPSPSPALATYSSCHVDGTYVAMTFDDGPSPGTTTRLLDILKQRNIKATFFMIGPNVVVHPEIARGFCRKGTKLATLPERFLSSPSSLTNACLKKLERHKRLSKASADLLRRCCDHLTEQSQIGFVVGFGELVGYSLRSVSGYLLAELSSRDRASAEG